MAGMDDSESQGAPMPHRTHSFFGYALTSVRSLPSQAPDTAAVALSAGAALVGLAFGAANVMLLWIVGLTMLLDLVAGAMLAVVDPLTKFDPKKLYGGFLGKLFRTLLIPTASLVDWLYIASPLPLPHGYEHAFPVTSLAMLALAAAELTSVLNKLRDGGVAPGVVAVITRHLDRIKYGGEPPKRRHYDLPAIAEERDAMGRKHRQLEGEP